MAGILEQFDPRHWANLAERRGWRFLWRRAQRCPCLDSSGHPNPDCAVCEGIGFSYEPGIETRATVGSATRKRDYIEQGTTEEGTVVIALAPLVWDRKRIPYRLKPNPVYEASEGDSLIAIDAVQTQSVVLERGRRDRLRSRYPVSIVNVQALRGEGTEAQTVDFTEGEDYRRDGRDIVWATAARPEPGEKYSVLYRYKPEFVLRTEVPAPHLNNARALPKRFTALLRDRVEG
jgi:hypothetical protein